MDVTQIPIKINQKSQSDGGKPKSTTKMDDSANSFDQILTRFNILSQTPESDRQPAASYLQNVSDKIGSEQIDPTKISAQDWSKLVSILTAWAAAIQQANNSPATQELIPGKLSSASELSNPPVVSNMLSQLQQVTAEGSKALVQWLQKVDGLYQTSTLDTTKLLEGLSQLIGKIQSREKQKSFDVPNNTGDKIQIIMNGLKTENKLGVITPFSNQFYKNKWLIDDKKQDDNLVSKPPDGPSEASSLQNVSDMTDSDQIDSTNLITEDWGKLDNILSAWVAEIMQGQYSQAAPQYPLEHRYSGSETQPPVVSAMLSPHQQVITDVRKALAKWLQKVDGLDQTSTLDPSQMLQRLAKLIEELQLHEKQKSVEVPDEIGNKIQIIFNALKTENTVTVRIPVNSQLHENGVLVDDKKQDGTKSTGLRLTENLPLQGLNESNVPKALRSSPPILPVSEFVSEVSELISGYMRISNGQLGATMATFSLYPEDLGNIKVEINIQRGQVSAKILTETTVAKKTLDGQLPYLNQALKQHGLFVQKLEILQQAPASTDLNQANQSFSQVGSDSSQEQQTITSAQGMNINKESRFERVPIPKQVEDLTKSNGMTFVVNHQSQGSDGGNVSKAVSSPPTLPVSEFVPEMSEWIGRNMRITNGLSGTTEAEFSLYPEHLGHIEIKITSQQGQVSAQIMTDTALAKETLEAQLPHLRQALQQHGLLVQKLDIVQQTPVSVESYQANQSFSQGGSGSFQEQQSFTSAQDGSKKQNVADEKEIEKQMLSITYGGAAPNSASSIDFMA